MHTLSNDELVRAIARFLRCKLPKARLLVFHRDEWTLVVQPLGGPALRFQGRSVREIYNMVAMAF